MLMKENRILQAGDTECWLRVTSVLFEFLSPGFDVSIILDQKSENPVSWAKKKKNSGKY